MFVLTIALTVLLAHLFPIDRILYLATGVMMGLELPHELGSYLTWAINIGPMIAVAWRALSWLQVPRCAAQLTRGRRIAGAGVVLYGVYFVLAIGASVLSAIPYGGGYLPRILELLLFAARGCFLAGLAVALCKELPDAKAATDTAC